MVTSTLSILMDTSTLSILMVTSTLSILMVTSTLSILVVTSYFNPENFCMPVFHSLSLYPSLRGHLQKDASWTVFGENSEREMSPTDQQDRAVWLTGRGGWCCQATDLHVSLFQQRLVAVGWREGNPLSCFQALGAVPLVQENTECQQTPKHTYKYTLKAQCKCGSWWLIVAISGQHNKHTP